MNLPKPMQHHSLQPRPQHIRHPMHQAPIHPGHPGHPPPHLAINMGPPPTPQQQPPLHIPNGPQARGPLPQQYSLQQMRDQSRLTHPQLAQQMTQQMQNQMQHHKGRQPLGGAPMKHAMMQKSFQTAAMRNNTQPNQKLQQQRLPMPPQVLPMNGGCGAAQIQLMKANMQNQQPQLQQIQQQQQQQQQIGQQQQKSNAIPIQQMPNINRQQTHQQQQHRPLLPPNNQKHSSSNRSRPNNRQTQQNPVHPRQILQNPNRANHLHKANVSTPTTLPTVSEVESTVVGTAQKSEELSATAEDFKPQNNQETSENEKANEEDNGLLSDFLSVVMKSKNCFTNSKEKTPMCLVNELARYNKIEHQYRLTGETGPAHCKRFTVTLKLGTEEYTAEGYKIKKAQHTAAAEAIKKTKYKHPLPKIIRRPEGTLRATITPSVELNALAMKLGQQTYYVFDQRSQQEPSPVSQDISEAGPVTNERLSGVGMLPQQQRFIAGKVFPPKYPMRIPSVNGYAPQPGHLTNGVSTELCKITLFVGKQKFVGCGKTLQAAKHDAASQALQILKAEAAKFKEILSRTPEDGDWKSPISLVHEIAIKRNLNVVFKVLREEGPAHMKNFITTCEVGNIITEGDGNGKKISKKRAAEKMLKELIKLPPPSPSKSPPVKRIKVKNFKRKTSPSTKKRGSSSIRDKSDAECEEETNPISKLIQIQQSRNEKGPVYELVARNGETKKKEFVIEVNVPGKVARGIGASKKLAKRSAAQNLLIAMGVETEDNANQENDSQIANQNPTVNCSRKVKFSEGNETTDRGSDTNTAVQSGNGGPSGRQIVPGVLLLRQHSKDTDETDHSAETSDNSRKDQTQSASPTTASEKSATTTTTTSSSSGGGVRPKDQLMYLAQILGFQVNYSDYPKGNHNEFLTIVTLSTSPPQICHGMGMNVEESQDQAASATLQILSKLGLDNVKPKTED